jgi:hypothetical protein
VFLCIKNAYRAEDFLHSNHLLLDKETAQQELHNLQFYIFKIVFLRTFIIYGATNGVFFGYKKVDSACSYLLV